MCHSIHVAVSTWLNCSFFYINLNSVECKVLNESVIVAYLLLYGCCNAYYYYKVTDCLERLLIVSMN